jgi:hypothetical protein
LGKVFDEAYKDGSFGIHGVEGVLFQVVPMVSVSSIPRSSKQYMMEMVEARKNLDKVEQHYDLFSGLLDAAQDEQGSEAALGNEELIGGWSTLRSLGTLGTHLICLLRKHVYFSYCWT